MFFFLASPLVGVFQLLLSLLLIGIPIGIMSSAIGLKICAGAAGTKRYNSIIKEK